MPRTARRSQRPVAPQDQNYGQAGEQLAAQRAVPLPDMRAPGAAASPPPAPGAPLPAGNPPVPSADPRAAAMQAAMGMTAGPGLLTGETARPNEPVTAGLATGPGPGPEALAPGDRVARTLERLAALSGDPGAAELAAWARLLGR